MDRSELKKLAILERREIACADTRLWEDTHDETEDLDENLKNCLGVNPPCNREKRHLPQIKQILRPLTFTTVSPSFVIDSKSIKFPVTLSEPLAFPCKFVLSEKEKGLRKRFRELNIFKRMIGKELKPTVPKLTRNVPKIILTRIDLAAISDPKSTPTNVPGSTKRSSFSKKPLHSSTPKRFGPRSTLKSKTKGNEFILTSPMRKEIEKRKKKQKPATQKISPPKMILASTENIPADAQLEDPEIEIIKIVSVKKNPRLKSPSNNEPEIKKKNIKILSDVILDAKLILPPKETSVRVNKTSPLINIPVEVTDVSVTQENCPDTFDDLFSSLNDTIFALDEEELASAINSIDSKSEEPEETVVPLPTYLQHLPYHVVRLEHGPLVQIPIGPTRYRVTTPHGKWALRLDQRNGSIRFCIRIRSGSGGEM